MEANRIILGDCLEVMRGMEDNCVDTIITDPPYGINFMGKKWDYDVPAIEIWVEALRVLKPGGTLLCFAGTRTYHRMVCNIEDAGFIPKDCIMWIFGSGFPKATDISKQLDKGHKREVIGTVKKHHYSGSNLDTNEGWARPSHRNPDGTAKTTMDITAPATPEAILWNGWKSHGLKPAYEPICMAMKPNDGTYANNALVHGVSGLNIDGGRIGTEDNLNGGGYTPRKQGNAWAETKGMNSEGRCADGEYVQPEGRFPPNVILDEEAGAMLDEQTGSLQSGNNCTRTKEGSFVEHGGLGKAGDVQITYGDKGGASRFFYCAKASKAERRGSKHPTIKPIKLMKWLSTITKTPTGGIVFDPFCGSGTTLEAAILTGRKFIGVDQDTESCDDSRRRIQAAKNSMGLFAGVTD